MKQHEWLLIITLAVILMLGTPQRSASATALASKIEGGYGDIVIAESAKFGIPYQRVFAQIYQESAGDTTAVGHDGERGLMQLLPGAITDVNARFGTDYTFDDMFDPEANITVGCAYLSILLSQFNGNLDLATQAYNAGAGNVIKSPATAGMDYLTRVKSHEPYFNV